MCTSAQATQRQSPQATQRQSPRQQKPDRPQARTPLLCVVTMQGRSSGDHMEYKGPVWVPGGLAVA